MAWPASFFTGPLGAAVPLPAEGSGLLGIFPGGNGYTLAMGRAQIADRQADTGCVYSVIQDHYDGSGNYGGVFGSNDPNVDSSGSSAVPPTNEDFADANGSISTIAWTPNYTLAQINAGDADTILQKMGLYWSQYNFPIMLRILHEFDLPNPTYTAHGYTAAQFISAWRHVVTQIQTGGGTNVGFWWCPTESLGMSRDAIAARYPGDAWVDWVGTDNYNYGIYTSSPIQPGWAQWWQMFNYSAPGVAQPYVACWSIYDIVSSGLAVSGTRGLTLPAGLPTQKPFMVGETGSLYDSGDVNSKRNWFTKILSEPHGIQSMTNCIGISFFDVDASPGGDFDWRVDRDGTAPGVVAPLDANTYSGYLSMASDPYFCATAGPVTPTQVTFGGEPTDTMFNDTITPAVTVRITDGGGNRDTSSTAAVTIAIGTNPAAGTLSGTLTVNAVAGIATFSDLSIDMIGVGYTLEASSPGLTSDTSTPFDITDVPPPPTPVPAASGVYLDPQIIG